MRYMSYYNTRKLPFQRLWHSYVWLNEGKKFQSCKWPQGAEIDVTNLLLCSPPVTASYISWRRSSSQYKSLYWSVMASLKFSSLIPAKDSTYSATIQRYRYYIEITGCHWILTRTTMLYDRQVYIAWYITRRITFACRTHFFRAHKWSHNDWKCELCGNINGDIWRSGFS